MISSIMNTISALKKKAVWPCVLDGHADFDLLFLIAAFGVILAIIRLMLGLDLHV